MSAPKKRRYHVVPAAKFLGEWGLVLGACAPLLFVRGGWQGKKWEASTEALERMQLLRLFSLVKSRSETLLLAQQQDLRRRMRAMRLDIMGDCLEGLR